jgi:hypothetical protein
MAVVKPNHVTCEEHWQGRPTPNVSFRSESLTHPNNRNYERTRRRIDGRP